MGTLSTRVTKAIRIEEFTSDNTRLTLIDEPHNSDVEFGQLRMIHHSIHRNAL